MALGAAAALLDELMGRARNFDPNEQPPELRWDSEEVCKHFLCAFCPHELFTNTRADLGLCNKIHDEALRKKYQESSRFEKMGYEEDFLRFLHNMISDVDKRIRRGHQRLALNNAQGTLNGQNNNSAKEDKINMLTEKINELVNQAEELGCEGKVEEAQGVMKLCDQLKDERTQIQNQSGNEEMPALKQMEVCEVCGAFLIVGDAPQRQDEHLMGKQHAGYAQVRAEIEKRKMRARAEVEEKLKAKEDKEREIEREREDRRKKEKEREEKDRRDRGDRDKDRDRNRDRDRDRDRDRRRRSRSRDKGRRSRSRDKERRRSRSRDRRRSRDRDRDSRRRRSRSRSHSRKSSKRSHRSRSRSRDKKSSSSSSRRDRDKDKERDRDRDSKKEERRSTSKSKSEERDSGKRPSEEDEKEKDEKEKEEKSEAPQSPPVSNGEPNDEGDTKKD